MAESRNKLSLIHVYCHLSFKFCLANAIAMIPHGKQIFDIESYLISFGDETIQENNKGLGIDNQNRNVVKYCTYIH